MTSTAETETRPTTTATSVAGKSGPVMAIGGAEDKFRDRIILSSFFQLAGGRDARIAIIPTASSIEAAGERYKAIFLEMGASEANVLFIGSREDANGESHVQAIQEATGIFMTGGNQMRLSALVSGTRVAQAIRKRHEAGVIVAGTSAGASILSSHMVAYGASGATPRMRMAQMIAGFGLVPELILDQHFRQRDRIGRLLSLVASNPGLIGVGIDEDTAALIDGQNVLEVVGRHSITVVDGQDM